MKVRWLSQFTGTQWMLILVPILVVLLPLWGVAHYIAQKHAYLAQQVQAIEPRYARLLALEQQKEELQQTLQKALQLRQRALYPADGNAAQIGNSVQNRLRGELLKTGLSIATSQVKVEKSKDDGGEESIQVHMTAEGTMSQIQLGLIALEEVQPKVWLDQVHIAHRGSLVNANAKVDPVLSVRMVFSVPRSKDSV